MNDYAADLKSKAKRIHRLATEKQVAESLYFSSEGTPGGGGDIPEGSAKWKKIDRGFAWVESVFDPVADLKSPKSAASVHIAMSRVVGESPIAKDLGGADKDKIDTSDLDLTGNGGLQAPELSEQLRGALTARWTGDAAKSFAEFIGKVPTATQNQVLVGVVLRDSMALYHNLLQGARSDAMAAADETIAVLESKEPGSSGEFTFNLKVASAAASLTGALLTVLTNPVGGMLSIFTGMVALGNSQGEGETARIGGLMVNDILHSLNDVVIQISTKEYDGETDLAAVLGGNQEFIMDSVARNNWQFVAPRPGTLVDNPDGAPYGDMKPVHPPA